MIIRFLNLGTDTIVDIPQEEREKLEKLNVEELLKQKFDTSNLKEKNCSISGNYQFFNKEKQSFLNELVEMLFKQRKLAKNLAHIKSKEMEEMEKEMIKRNMKIPK
jgi:hypothetical protein